MGFNLKNIFSFLNNKNDEKPVIGKINSTNYEYEVGQLDQTFFGLNFEAADLPIIMDGIVETLNGADASSISDPHRANLYKDLFFAQNQYTTITGSEYDLKDPEGGAFGLS